MNEPIHKKRFELLINAPLDIANMPPYLVIWDRTAQAGLDKTSSAVVFGLGLDEPPTGIASMYFGNDDDVCVFRTSDSTALMHTDDYFSRCSHLGQSVEAITKMLLSRESSKGLSVEQMAILYTIAFEKGYLPDPDIMEYFAVGQRLAHGDIPITAYDMALIHLLYNDLAKSATPPADEDKPNGI